MNNGFTAILFLAFIGIACGSDYTASGKLNNGPNDSLGVKIELYDTAALAAIDSNATIEIIGRNYDWSEGPVWVAKERMLLFSDVPQNKVYRWIPGDTPTVFLTPSGYTGTVKRNGGEDGANGLALDKNGNLLLCQSGNRCIASMTLKKNTTDPVFTILSGNYNGKKYNSPNDLVADSKGNIFFTDPIYGLPQQENDATRELSFEGVYKIDASGKTTLLIDSISRPNGIALSADEKIIYIASSDDSNPRWYAYTLDERQQIKTGGVLLDATLLKHHAAVKQGADGFKLDAHGNIFSAGPDGINIISPAGKLIALIKVPVRKTSNCAFDEVKKILFVTADDLVLKITLHP